MKQRNALKVALASFLGMGIILAIVSCSSAPAKSDSGWQQVGLPAGCDATSYFPNFDGYVGTPGNYVVCKDGRVFQHR